MNTHGKKFEVKKTFGLSVLLKLTRKSVQGVETFRPVPLKSCLFSDIYAASLNSTSFFSNHALLSLFLLIAVIDARAIEPFFDQLIPLFF